MKIGIPQISIRQIVSLRFLVTLFVIVMCVFSCLWKEMLLAQLK